MTTKIDALEKRLDALEKEISRYKGFLGGVVFIVSGLVTFLSIFWDVIATKLGLK